ncbi:hypothetical protein ODS41_02370 [Pyrobaculum sp. 3827-6]|uniref:hypothetical protein n=1 Tax=Pyrobaculum sp. 3827-6 TaxID=2983604 RepID=UPI0021D961E1|nr:hypothetical protein [Pyrobaculum sp. 3827-6]MCU7786775.1 hypothetical protein [Pyrobaculum sp. 3827-6]
MDSRKVIAPAVVAAVLLASLAYGADTSATGNMDFHLWLKCKAIELYLNATGANFTLPQCQTLLSEINKTFIIGRWGYAPRPMIGIGELRKLNLSDPKAVFQEIRQARLAAIKELGKHINKTIHYANRLLNESRDVQSLLNSTDRGLAALMRVRNLLSLVNASRRAVEAVDENIKWLNLTRWLIHEEAKIYRRIAAGNVSEVDIEKVLAEVEKVRDRLRELFEHFERVKIAGFPRQWAAERIALLNNTAALLHELRGLDIAARQRIIKDLVSGRSIGELISEARSAKTAHGGGPGNWKRDK